MTSKTPPLTHFERLTQQTNFIGMRAFHANTIFRQHPRLDKVGVEYIYTNHCVARATVPLMEEALRCALARKDDPVCVVLADYLRKHIVEEQDHDKWYVRDLQALGMSESQLFARIPSPNIAAMIGSQYYWVKHHHPVAFMGYICSTEAYPPTVDYVNELIEKSGLPAAGFDTLMLHAEIDKTHKNQIVEQLNALPLTEAHHNIIQMSAFQTFRYMALLMEEVCRVAPLDSIDKSVGAK